MAGREDDCRDDGDDGDDVVTTTDCGNDCDNDCRELILHQ